MRVEHLIRLRKVKIHQRSVSIHLPFSETISFKRKFIKSHGVPFIQSVSQSAIQPAQVKCFMRMFNLFVKHNNTKFVKLNSFCSLPFRFRFTFVLMPSANGEMMMDIKWSVLYFIPFMAVYPVADGYADDPPRL